MAWLPAFLKSPQADRAEALEARVLAGDAGAIEDLYRREAGAVYRFALAMSGNEAWSADALQDAFLVLLSGQAHWDNARSRPGGLAAYLCGIARHHLLAQHRAAYRWTEWDESTADDADPEAVEDPLSARLRIESIEALHAALRALPWPQREAVVLVDLQERDYEQASQIAGISINTLRTRLFRARRKLQSVLGAQASGAAPAVANQEGL